MIELDIKNFIDANLTHPAYMQKPNSNGAFFVIEKIGESQEEHIRYATVAIQSYGSSLYESAQIADTLNDAMIYDFVSLPNVVKVKLNSSYNFPDTEEKRFRYQSVFDITYYGGNENE